MRYFFNVVVVVVTNCLLAITCLRTMMSWYLTPHAAAVELRCDSRLAGIWYLVGRHRGHLARGFVVECLLGADENEARCRSSRVSACCCRLATW